MTPDVARRQDDLIRSTSRIDDAEIAVNLDPSLREALLASLADEPAAQRSWRAGHRRFSIALGVAGALIASTAAAYAGHEAWQRLHPDQSVVVGCVDSQDAQHQPLGTSVPIPSGDPLADCAAVWELTFGEAAPELAAYTAANGTVMVQPKAWATPADWTPLATDFKLDAPLLELDHSLDDQVRGLNSRCFSAAEGRSFTEMTLARLGLVGWVVEHRDDPDDDGPCAIYTQADPERKVVQLGGRESQPLAGLPYEKMGVELQKTPACLPHDQALAAIKQAAESAGIPEGIEGYTLVEPYAEPGAEPRCLRIVMIVGGGITVELWG